MNFAERRKVNRINGKIPVELKEGGGFTRDFSTEGVYFETDQPISVGEELDFTMLLNFAYPAHSLQLCCTGKVLRVVQGGEARGVAVSITKQRLIALDKS